MSSGSFATEIVGNLSRLDHSKSWHPCGSGPFASCEWLRMISLTLPLHQKRITIHASRPFIRLRIATCNASKLSCRNVNQDSLLLDKTKDSTFFLCFLGWRTNGCVNTIQMQDGRAIVALLILAMMVQVITRRDKNPMIVFVRWFFPPPRRMNNQVGNTNDGCCQKRAQFIRLHYCNSNDNGNHVSKDILCHGYCICGTGQHDGVEFMMVPVWIPSGRVLVRTRLFVSLTDKKQEWRLRTDVSNTRTWLRESTCEGNNTRRLQ